MTTEASSIPLSQAPAGGAVASMAEGMLARNLSALGPSAPVSPSDLEAWCHGGGAHLTPSDPEGGRVAASRIPLGFAPTTPETTATHAPRPILIAGLSDPWLLERVLEATHPCADGYRPRIFVVEPDTRRALQALSSFDFSILFESASVEVLMGADADSRLSQALLATVDYALPDSVLAVNPHSEVVQIATRVLQECRERQQAELRNLLEEVSEARAGRTPDWWARRYADALSGGEALRVLLLTTRFATYVNHAASGLAEAISRSGHRAELLVEPADDTKLSALAYVRAHRDLDPDLVVSINWPRAMMGHAWPPGVPSVCWIQDMMGHLLDPEVGRAQGHLDFVVGQIHGSLFRDYSYPIRNRMFSPLPASSGLFRRPENRATNPRFTCDVAYVGHGSAPPEHLVETAKAGHAGSAEIGPIIEGVARRVDALLGGDGPVPIPDLWALTRDVIHEVIGQTPNDAIIGRIHLLFTLPYAERAHRHTTLRWAAAICADHQYSLKLFGNGWNAHPLFAPFASGAIAHGTELRDAYATPRCHLHASLCTNAHQRVFECALSGGLMLRRGPTPDESVIRSELIPRIAELDPGVLAPVNRRFVYVPSSRSDPDETAYDAVRHANALNEDAPCPVSPGSTLARMRLVSYWPQSRPEWVPRCALEQFPDWAFDTARETLFTSKEQLEQQIVRAVEDRQWREQAIADHEKCAKAFNSTDAFWERLVRTVRTGITEEAEASKKEEPPATQADQNRLLRNIQSLEEHRPSIAAMLHRRLRDRRDNPFRVTHSPDGSRSITRNDDDHGPDPGESSTLEKLRTALQMDGAAAVMGIGDSRSMPILPSRPMGQHGATHALYLCEPDLDRLHAALLAQDLTGPDGPIAARHVEWFVGPSWVSAFVERLKSNPLLPLPRIRVHLGAPSGDLDRACSVIASARESAHRNNAEAARDRAASRPACDLVAAIRGDAGRNPRALLFTSRFSTVLSHSLAAAEHGLRDLGWSTHLLTEQDDHERLSSEALLESIAQFKPDLILSIDHHRHEYAAIPHGIPFVCWIQDDLLHLIAPDIGSRLGERDYAVCTWAHRYVAQWGYPVDRSFVMPRLTAARPQSAAKLSASPHHDLLYVSNHSICAEVALENLARLAGNETPEARATIATGQTIIDVYAQGGSLALPRQIRSLLEEAAANEGIDAPEKGWLDKVTEILCLQINNPLYRQQGLRWAASAARRRGLDLAIYGEGWEDHPHFAPHAQGSVPYGEDLWSLIGAARFNLRLEPYPAMAHQRLIDCCAAGGLVLNRSVGCWEEPEHRLVTFFLEHLAGRARTAQEAADLLDQSGRNTLDRCIAGVWRVFPHLEGADMVRFNHDRLEQGSLVDYERSPLPPRFFDTVFTNEQELADLIQRFEDDPADAARLAEEQQQAIQKRHAYQTGLGNMLSQIVTRIGAEETTTLQGTQ